MSQLEWNDSNLPSLGKLFLMRVEKNMRAGSTVRFGLMGNGSNPNYELELPNGRHITYGGLSHKQDERVDAFDEKKLSPPFTLAQIQGAIARTPSVADTR